jgi:hypothetical protein
VFSIALAGGGMKRGLVYGASDPTGGEPETDPLTVENFAATIYHQMGIQPDKELIAPGNRPVRIVNGGEVVRELVG